jgi:hypothetical protein
VRDVNICTEVYYFFIENIEILKTSLATQIMLASQFVHFLEHTRC